MHSNKKIENNCYYHIFNRGTEKRNIFIDEKDYYRFLRSLIEFNCIKPIGSLRQLYKDRGDLNRRPIPPKSIEHLVEIIAYCLIPNHYHLLLKQERDRGISEFIKRLGGGYTNYFNKKYNHQGALFQGKYKIIEVKNYSHLLKLFVYINFNSEIHKISSAEIWPWSSIFDYKKKRSNTIAKSELMLKEFGSYKEFINFSKEAVVGIIEIKELKKLLLE